MYGEAHRSTAGLSPGLDDNSPLRLAMTGELRRAIESGELAVHYQPQVDFREGRVRGARHSCAGGTRDAGSSSPTHS